MAAKVAADGDAIQRGASKYAKRRRMSSTKSMKGKEVPEQV